MILRIKTTACTSDTAGGSRFWRQRPLVVAALLPWLAAPSLGLEWKAQSQTVTTTPFQATRDIVFEFRNNSTEPVTITDLQTNCDCLEAQADQKTYPPAATGNIRARFTVGDRSGPYQRTITVVTDEAESPIRLQVRIEVPEVCAVMPRSVTWALQAPSHEQVVDVRPADGLEINFTEVQSTTAAFQARLETVVPGRHYRLHLVPRSTTEPASAAVRIMGREKSGHSVVVSAYASVQ